MTLHPFIESEIDPYERLRVAHFWEVADRDFRNAEYWRSQIDECMKGIRLLCDAWIDSPQLTTEVKNRRLKQMHRACGDAMSEGYGRATVARRQAVSIPKC